MTATLLNLFLTHVLPHLLPLVLSLLGMALAPLVAMAAPKIHALIASKVRNDRLRAFLDTLTDVATLQVTAVGQTTVDAAKGAAADGKLPKDIAAEALKAALDGTKTSLGPALLKEAEKLLGDPAAVEELIKAALEAAVAKKKAEASVAAMVPGVAVAAPTPKVVVPLPDADPNEPGPHVLVKPAGS